MQEVDEKGCATVVTYRQLAAPPPLLTGALWGTIGRRAGALTSNPHCFSWCRLLAWSRRRPLSLLSQRWRSLCLSKPYARHRWFCGAQFTLKDSGAASHLR